MAKDLKEQIEIMNYYLNGGEIEYVERGCDNWELSRHPYWNWDDFDYKIKKFQYPMWFKSTSSSLVVRFDNLNSGEVIAGNVVHKIGEYYDNWIEHTSNHWEEIEEPIAKQKVTIEKWLIEENDIKFVVETSDIDSWLKSFPTAKKLKLIESYEVEI